MHSTTVSENSKPSHWVFLAVALWAAFTIAAMIFFVRSNLQVFDENETVAQQFESTTDYLEALSTEFSERIEPGSVSLFRIQEPGCRCNLASGAHWRHLTHEYENAQLNVIEFDSAPESLKALVPATPMAVFIDETGQALYAGPFSDALYCNSENSLVEAYLTKLATVPFAPLHVEGCFCERN